jgi:hypothetical protein
LPGARCRSSQILASARPCCVRAVLRT